MKILFKELGKFKKKMFLLILCVIGITLGELGWPNLMARLIDKAIPNKDYSLVFGYCSAMIILVVFVLFCGICSARLSVDMAMGVGKNLRSQVFRKVQSLSQQEMDSFSTSSLITRTNNDINQVQVFLNNCLSIAFTAPIMCIFGIVMSVMQSPDLAKVLYVAVPIMVIVIVIIGRIAVPLANEIQRKIDKLNLVMREDLTGVRVIRAFGTTGFEEAKFDALNMEYRKTNKKMQNTTNLLMPVLTVILALAAGSVLFFAASQYVIYDVRYTIGDVMAIVSYVMTIMLAVVMMTVVFILLPRAATSASRIKEVLDSVNDINCPEEPCEESAKQGYIEFKDVSFTYKGASKPALNNLSFKTAPGEVTAIIGGTGMGKSTIINLIPRLYDVTSGQVLVDGIDVRDYDLETLRVKIGFVPQKAMLFSGTIDSNIKFGKKDATELDVEEAVKIAQSYDFVIGKEDGFMSTVEQGGTNFSGGQRQRLAIARAVVRQPEIYVFDDSFSALDFKTDKALRKEISKHTDNAATIIVAQRISTIMDADRIIVVDSGDVVGIGTHEELLTSCDVYREIAKSQLGEEETK